MEMMAAAGHPHDVLLRRPPLASALRRYFDMYFELDRSETGAPLFTSMLRGLDELGVRDPRDREEVRSYWWAMWNAHHAAEKAKAEARKKREQERANGMRGWSNEDLT